MELWVYSSYEIKKLSFSIGIKILMKRNIRKYLQVLEYFIKRTKWKKEQKKIKKIQLKRSAYSMIDGIFFKLRIDVHLVFVKNCTETN